MIADGQWWLVEIEQISSLDHKTSFKKSPKDQVRIQTINILRKLSVIVLKTATGRSYSTPQKLSEEIIVLLNDSLGLKVCSSIITSVKNNCTTVKMK